jgi:hypothetical protein
VEIKHILMHTARDITTGTCLQGHPAKPGPDLAKWIPPSPEKGETRV